MKRYFIETSAIVDYLKGKEKMANLIDNLDSELTSSYICLAELYEGIYRVKSSEEMEESVKTFFQSLSEIFGIDEEISKNFGRIRSQLKKSGIIIEDLDILIGVTCLTYNLILITNNVKHFQRIENLKLLSTYN